MQRFVNGWSTTLQAQLLASDTAMQVPSALAAKLLLDSGDFCDLVIDPTGAAPEIVRVTAIAGGSLTLGSRAREGSVTPTTWPAGTKVAVSITAAYLQALQQAGGGANRFVSAPGGTTVIPADTALVSCQAVPDGTTELTLPAPAAGSAYVLDLQIWGRSTAIWTLRLQVPGCTVGEMGITTATVEADGDTMVITDMDRTTFARAHISNSTADGLYLDVTEFYTAAATPPG
ncbi:hypothetical protein [Pseudomonas tohonis]|uniref:hypothetical protein n=1 Tax=Pseudomonas tohonis TaxID=2725477 RepID=UPI001F2E012D|nr:hypothetical protein [Pseudomonas tohonis]